jgi:hypothetical protein
MLNSTRKYIFEIRSIIWAKQEYIKALNRNFNGNKNTINKLESILHINTSDSGGGAAKIASDLCKTQIKNGFISKMLVATIICAGKGGGVRGGGAPGMRRNQASRD